MEIINGISLRDYMAIHSTQPGISEICSVAGVVWSAGKVWRKNDTDNPIGTFEKFLSSMSLEEQLDLCSRVKYAQADSMLRVRLLTTD